MHMQTHSEITSAAKLAISLLDIVRTSSDDTYNPKPNNHRFSKSRKEGGERICIESRVRAEAERFYRRKAKFLTDKAAYDDSVIVPNIDKCQVYHWRW